MILLHVLLHEAMKFRFLITFAVVEELIKIMWVVLLPLLIGQYICKFVLRIKSPHPGENKFSSIGSLIMCTGLGIWAWAPPPDKKFPLLVYTTLCFNMVGSFIWFKNTPKKYHGWAPNPADVDAPTPGLEGTVWPPEPRV
jgi:hypothetical protein